MHQARSPADKVRRHCAAKRTGGLRQLRLWAPDVRSPAFAGEAARQAALLRDAPEEADALAFIAAAADTSD